MSHSKRGTGFVAVTRPERHLMLQRFDLPDDIRLQLEDAHRESSEIWLTSDQADELREQAGALFQEIGLSADYKATANGRLLEGLIDKFFTG